MDTSYRWVAIYKGGEKYPQINPDTNIERSLDSINRSRLDHFILLKPQYVNNQLSYSPVIVQHYEPGQRPILRRRVQKTIGEPDVVCYLVGWQKIIKGEHVQHISYAFEGGCVHNAGCFNESHPWFYSIQTHDKDREEVKD